MSEYYDDSILILNGLYVVGMFDILMQRRFELPFISTHHTHKEACPKRAKEREFNP